MFRWCGEQTRPFESLELVYRIAVDGGTEYFTVARGDGRFTLRTGGEFTSLAPPAGLEYQQSGAIPTDEYPLVLFVYADEVQEGRADDLASIHIDDPRAIAAGRWVSPQGVVDEVPC